MSRKQTVRKIQYEWEHGLKSLLDLANRAYDAGRIAGLREAAKIVDPPPDNSCVGAEEYAIAADWLKEAAGQLRERADRLGKKARKNRGK